MKLDWDKIREFVVRTGFIVAVATAAVGSVTAGCHGMEWAEVCSGPGRWPWQYDNDEWHLWLTSIGLLLWLMREYDWKQKLRSAQSAAEWWRRQAEGLGWKPEIRPTKIKLR